MINSSSDNVKKLNSINRRMFITGSVKFFIMIGLVSRLFFLQVKENKRYLTLSDKNRIREWKLAPVRGEFKDYFGNTIAGNFEAYQLHIIPEQVEDFRYVIYRIKDWFYFLFIISLINSINYSVLTLFFSFNLILMNYLVNTFFTFTFYIVFVSIFNFYLKGLND